MGFGFARLNCVTIIQTSQGLAEYLMAKLPSTAEAGIAIGYDSRRNSQKFAQLAAAVFESKGITVWWYEETVHTPLVPFAVKTLQAAAGIMVTVENQQVHFEGSLMSFLGKS